MILKDLFSDISGFAEFVPGIDANTNLSSLNSHAVTAYKRIANIISVPVYEKILEKKEDKLYDHLRTALANLTMANDTVFDVVRKRNGEYRNLQVERKLSGGLITKITIMQWIL